MSKKGKIYVEGMSILDAIDNLTSLSELNEIENSPSAPPLNALRFVEKGREEESLKKVKQTFRVVLNYLKDIYLEKKDDLKNPENQKGVRAIMTLAGEAIQKLDRYTTLLAPLDGTVEEYEQLQKFYHEKMGKKVSKAKKGEEKLDEEWDFDENHLDIQRRGLRDLETVKGDQRYELFYLNKEDGRPFFNKNLIRHIKLVNDFDTLFANTEHNDPFVKMSALFDRDLHASAKEMREKIQNYLKTFYRSAHNEMRTELVSSLYNALSALSLAKNQPKNGSGKSCALYFSDFHNFLRQALSSAEYFHHVNQNGEENDALSRATIQILHHVAYQFFTREPHGDEIIGWLHAISSHAPSKKRSHKSSLAFWNDLLDTHEATRENLQKFPSGPLFKTLDVFQDRQNLGGFDPLAQNNLPHRVYTLKRKKAETHLLRLPSPTRQVTINEAIVVDEFQAFLRECAEKKKVYVMCSLQDLTSWEESARVEALIEVQKKAAFSKTFFVFVLPKNTEFYHQSGDYIDISKAKEFIPLLQEQFASGKECGFFIPQRLPEFREFMPQAIEFVHKRVFGKKKVLTRKNRLDFIEMVYQLVYLKMIEMLAPDYLSFTCKDSVDTGAAATAGFFAFIKLLFGELEWDGEEQDFFHWMLFSPALTIRERSIDNQRLSRMVSMLATLTAEIETDGDKVRKDLKKLFSKDLLSHIRVI